jgi:hypothetical protein
MLNVLEGLELIEGRWLLVGAAAVVGLAKGGRPLAKGAIKGYLAVRDGMQRMTATTRQSFQDLYDEASTEYRRVGRTAGKQSTPTARRAQPRRSRGGAPAPSAEAA